MLPLVGSGITVSFMPTVRFSMMLTDSEVYWVKVVVFNLIHNAVKFSPPSGRVDVLCAKSSDGQIVLSVTDQGAGIPPENLERIFEPHFHQGTAEEAGSGLGLATVSRLVKQLGWGVSVLNLPSGGSRFDVTVPPNWRVSDEAQSAAS
jgi:signal transduction histidine kinase